jgi:hypothetical protein
MIVFIDRKIKELKLTSSLRVIKNSTNWKKTNLANGFGLEC